MNKIFKLLLLVVSIITTLACSLVTGKPEQPLPEQSLPEQSQPTQEEYEAYVESTPTPELEPIILFEDDFSDTSSGWDRNDWNNGTTDYYNGVYRMLVKKTSHDIWANPGKYFDGDVRIEVEATKVGGEDDNDYGIICRYTGQPSSPSYYFFLISSDGFAVIGKETDGDSKYLSSAEMQQSDAIIQGSATNKLRADCIGSTLTLYVNEQLVVSTSDSAYTAGDVGLIAGTFDIPSAEIHFDNFVVTKP